MGKVQTEIDIPQVINYQATTVNVGTTTTLNSNQNATVSNDGTETNAILNFGIPKGKSAYEQAVEGGYTGTEQEFRTYMANSANYASAAHAWAEGTDEEVEALGGEHSAEGWAAIAQQATSGKQDVSNLVTSISADSTDSQYPSAKLTYDQLATKANKDLDNLSTTGENHFVQLKTGVSQADVAYVVETYSNGTSWYRVYSDGWCEQGGYVSQPNTTISLLKEFVDTNYSVLTTFDASGNPLISCGYSQKATDGFYLFTRSYGPGDSFNGVGWEAKGYIS